MLKAYAFGFFSAALAVLLVAMIWIGTQPKQEAGLLWGDTVYTSKQEFNGYPKSNGLSYKTWVARNPGAAPWEPEEVTIGAITLRVSAERESVVRVLLVAFGLVLALGCALLLMGRERPVLVRFVGGSVLFFSVFSAVVLVAIWSGAPPKQPPSLLWGGEVYLSKQEFNGYLKSKGLSYKTWVARNPGAAPWEPAAVRVPTKAPEATRARHVTKAPQASRASEGWVGRPLLAAMGLMLASACGLLLFWGRRPVLARFASGSVALYDPGAIRIGKGGAGRPTASASIERLGVAASGATGRLRVLLPRYGERLLGGVSAFGRLLFATARAVKAGSREVAWRLIQLMHERNIGAGDVTVVLLAVVSAVLVGLVVVVGLSSL